MATQLRDRLELKALKGDFGIEALGIDISRPLDPAISDRLRAAFDRHRILVVRGQSLTPEAHIAFSRNFGELEVHVLNEYHKPTHPEIFELSNIGADGRPNAVHPDRGTLFWHTDASFQAKPALATILYAERAPANGGHTMFADMIGAYEALGQAERERFAKLRVRHDLNISRLKAGYPEMSESQKRNAPPVVQPLVRLHPPTGRKAIYLGSHGQEFVGMPPLESLGMMERIMNHATEPRFVYEHVWREGDLVMWDNRATVHRGTEYDTAVEPRVVRRTVIKGDAPIAAG
ncbi:MAG: TauD/TfdA family dioxygenase [Alphaproteobacteria bacterium]|nr:TauD/TfdA family dioxygenase [Alphaproteobacteria bacterium]